MRLGEPLIRQEFVIMPQAMKIPDATAAVDKESATLSKLLAWQMTKVRSKREVSSNRHKRWEGQFILLR